NSGFYPTGDYYQLHHNQNILNSVTSINSVTHYRITDSKTEPCKDSHENLFDSASSDGASDDEVWAPMPVRGTLSKWTNLLHGWQERYFVLSDGMLTYYRNSDELGLGSRGAVRVRLADVKAHEYDDCRFEVSFLGFRKLSFCASQ
ncbi:Collagen type IV alpha-3-binding protein, partial [Fasciola gigantica]